MQSTLCLVWLHRCKVWWREFLNCVLILNFCRIENASADRPDNYWFLLKNNQYFETRQSESRDIKHCSNSQVLTPERKSVVQSCSQFTIVLQCEITNCSVLPPQWVMTPLDSHPLKHPKGGCENISGCSVTTWTGLTTSSRQCIGQRD